MSKQHLISWAGGVRELAGILDDCTTQAIYAWQAVPPGRLYEMMVKRPLWFDAAGQVIEPLVKHSDADFLATVRKLAAPRKFVVTQLPGGAYQIALQSWHVVCDDAAQLLAKLDEMGCKSE